MSVHIFSRPAFADVMLMSTFHIGGRQRYRQHLRLQNVTKQEVFFLHCNVFCKENFSWCVLYWTISVVLHFYPYFSSVYDFNSNNLAWRQVSSKRDVVEVLVQKGFSNDVAQVYFTLWDMPEFVNLKFGVWDLYAWTSLFLCGQKCFLFFIFLSDGQKYLAYYVLFMHH